MEGTGWWVEGISKFTLTQTLNGALWRWFSFSFGRNDSWFGELARSDWDFCSCFQSLMPFLEI